MRKKRKHSRLCFELWPIKQYLNFELYPELTGDKSVADNKRCKEADERMQLILKIVDKAITRFKNEQWRA